MPHLRSLHRHRRPRRPRRRRRLRHRTVTFWLAAVLSALAVGALTHRTATVALSDPAAWGSTRLVPVASRRLPVGDVLTAADVVWREVPEELLVDDPPSDPVGRVAVGLILEDEPIVSARLGPDGLDGVRALLPPGTRAVAVSPVGPVPDLRVGDRVDVVAAPLAETLTSVVVAADVPVVDVLEDTVPVAVERAASPDTAIAATQGLVTLVLRP